MGTDIRGTVEKVVNGKWVMVNRLGNYFDVTFRDYKVFAALAGVRGDGPEPKGLPKDISDSTKLYVDECGDGIYNESWYMVEEAAKILMNVDSHNIERCKGNIFSLIFKLFAIDDESNLNLYRFVFWFDN